MDLVNPTLGPELGRKEKWTVYDSVLDALKMLVHEAFLSILKDVSDLFSILMMRLRN